ncbi:MAG: lipopolysaccharide biosynthesis protein [Sphingorhabdus sp.]|uniref:lipopolysaccharide biosynthesis protein n=1 Tax=Sphingorhabdus sp. TaxID=1902408 RepID=UPI0038FCFF29
MTVPKSAADGVTAEVTPAWRKKGFEKGWLKSILHLVSGSAGNAILMLISTMIAARTLGPAAYGVLALVLTVGRLSERLLRFESWQPLIRFAASEDIAADKKKMSELYLYGLFLDIGTALLAAVLTMIVGYALMTVIGLEPEHMPLLAIYAVAIAMNIRGVPTAALRFDGQFRTLAYVQMLSSVLRLAMAGVGLVLGFSLLEFVIVWTVCQALDSLLFLWLGLRVIRKQGIPSPFRANPFGLKQKFPGFMSFAWSTNISGTLRTLTQEADTLLVSAFAGTAWAGFYHIAKRIAKVAQQVGAMMQAVVYPDMARMWAQKDVAAFSSTIKRVQLVLGAVGVAFLGAFWLVGDWMMKFVFGPEFAQAYPLLVAQLLAVVLIMHAAPSRSALLSMNRPGFVLWVAIASTILFFVTAWITMPTYGALGANFAHIAFAALTAIAMDIAMWRQIGQTAKATKE